VLQSLSIAHFGEGAADQLDERFGFRSASFSHVRERLNWRAAKWMNKLCQQALASLA
jgi:hypothetical protein